jgi:hypothetical protein
VGHRSQLFFLHDGRTADRLQAIEAHADCGGKNSDHYDNHDRFQHSYCGSEANGVLRNFDNLNLSQVQDILNFLRSLKNTNPGRRIAENRFSAIGQDSLKSIRSPETRANWVAPDTASERKLRVQTAAGD